MAEMGPGEKCFGFLTFTNQNSRKCPKLRHKVRIWSAIPKPGWQSFWKPDKSADYRSPTVLIWLNLI